MSFLKLRENLILQENGDELLVYDPDSHEVHLLREPLVTICHALQAGQTWDQLADAHPKEELESALTILEQKKLLRSDGLTRRSFLSNAAAVAALVVTVAAPRPVAAASNCVTNGNTNCTATDGQSCTPCTTGAVPNPQCRRRTCTNRYEFLAPTVPSPRPAVCSGFDVGDRVCPEDSPACYRRIGGGEPSTLIATDCRNLSTGGPHENQDCTAARRNARRSGQRCRYFCCGPPV